LFAVTLGDQVIRITPFRIRFIAAVVVRRCGIYCKATGKHSVVKVAISVVLIDSSGAGKKQECIGREFGSSFAKVGGGG